MSKVLMINGSPNVNGCTYVALSEIKKVFNKNGIESEIYHIGNKPISGCIACYKCMEIGKCVIEDQINVLNARLNEFDAIIVGAPVYYAGPSGQICSFLDRLFFSSRGKMTGKIAAAVVSCRRGGASAAFDRLNKYFTISNMIVVGSQYWNQVHGMTPEDVYKDEEGLQTMRTLAQNITWLLQSIEAGKKAGVKFPVYEERKSTNFIES